MDVLAKLFDHGNWANRELVRACAALDAAQLDARPLDPAAWSIRENLTHLVDAQRRYVALLTLPREKRVPIATPWPDLEAAADASGAALLELARNPPEGTLRTNDGYRAAPWVVLVQALHHAIEHRKQVATLMRALDLEPPPLDGWAYGEANGALVPDR